MAPNKIYCESDKNMPNIGAAMLAKITGRVSTRSQSNICQAVKMLPEKKFSKAKDSLSKRKADQLSPPKGKTTKRSALADINNKNMNMKMNNQPCKKSTVVNEKQAQNHIKQKEIVKITTIAETKAAVVINLKPSSKVVDTENVDPKAKPVKHCKNVVNKENAEPKDSDKFDSIHKVTSSGKLSNKFRRSLDTGHDKSDESSLYTSALDEVSHDGGDSSKILSPVKKLEIKDEKCSDSPKVPAGVEDFDKENMLDPIQVSNYAMEIFEYMKQREKTFQVDNYMSRQVLISPWMRSLLVDWMVEVQENFELNHETLYLGVKITDVYLNKIVVGKEILQLVGAAALFIASKYDERMPPLIDDFIYICENAFTRDDIIKMEMDVFRVIGFNLGIPLSYRFLRRYARCCKATMPTLTLARYILELSLMEYHFIFVSESKIAAAALYLALRMKKISGWTTTLEYYSGYKLPDFMEIALELNSMLHKKPKDQLKTVRNKYSHKIFFEVAKTPLIDDIALCTEPTKESLERKV